MKKIKYIVVNILLYFFILLPAQAKEMSFSFFIDENNTFTAEEAAARFSALNDTENKCDNDTIRTSLGFSKGTFWCLLSSQSENRELPPPNTIQIISFGAESVDSIEAFHKAPDDNKYYLYDSTGFAVPNAKKQLVSWRMAIPVSTDDFPDGKYLFKIKNSDATNLTIKFYTPQYFFFQTVLFTILHMVFILLMLFGSIFLLAEFIIHRENSLKYLSIMSFAFLLYQLARKGLGPVYLWNFASSLLIFKRTGYLAATCGYLFAMILLIRIVDGKSFPLYKHIPKVLFCSSIICFVLYLFVTNIFIPYIFSLICLLFGNLYIAGLCIYLNVKKKNTHTILIFAWTPLFFYVVFRQSIHLLRIWIDVSSIMTIFDNDFYFGYDICFLLTSFISGNYILKNIKKEISIKKQDINLISAKQKNKSNKNSILKKSSIIVAEHDNILLDKMKPLFSSCTTKKFVKNGIEVLKHTLEFKPDIIIADSAMPKMNALNLYYECKKRDDLKNVPIIILTAADNISFITGFENDGLVDFLVKPFSFDELIHKVEFIISLSRACRESYANEINCFLQQSLNHSQTITETKNHPSTILTSRMELYTKYRLSHREIEIAEMIYDNHTNKEIGEILYVSTSTIATHVKHIYEKFQVTNRNEWLKMIMNIENN